MRDLDRDRSGIGEEHAVEIARQQRRETLRQRQGRLMHEPAEHDMRHHVELALHRGANMRMIVAVAGGPPRRDAVDQLAAVGQDDPCCPACVAPAAGGRPVFICA